MDRIFGREGFHDPGPFGALAVRAVTKERRVLLETLFLLIQACEGTPLRGHLGRKHGRGDKNLKTS